MYKISSEVIKYIENTMQNWKVELTAREKSLTEVKIQSGIFDGDPLSSLLFVIAMMPFNHILKKCAGGYKIHKSYEHYAIKILDQNSANNFLPKDKFIDLLISNKDLYANSSWKI